MSHDTGLLFTFIALFSWGFGDFFIQKTTRAIGSWKALFFIGTVGFFGLFPLVRHELTALSGAQFLLLGLLTIVIFFSTAFDFEALRQGKIAIVEPILSLELPITVGLSLALAHESISAVQTLLIGVVFIGILLAITAHHTHLHYHKRIFEQGVILAGLGAIGMGLTNFLVGVSSQGISPLVTIWFTHSSLAVVSLLFLIFHGQHGELIADFRKYRSSILAQSTLDNLAWVSFAQATTFIPIAIVTAISESYIALAVLLGLFVNREKLKAHQMLGVAFATIGVIALSYFS